MTTQGDLLHVVTSDDISARRRAFGRTLIWGTGALLILVALLQTLQVAGRADFGFTNWRPTLYAYITWSIALCWGSGHPARRTGKRALFVLPAVLFVVSLAIVVPMIFGLVIAFSDWNLSSPDGRKFNGLDNIRQMWTGPVLLERAEEHGLVFAGHPCRIRHCLRPGADARLPDPRPQILPRGLPPATHALARRGVLDGGKSMLEPRFGPLARLARQLGWDNPSFFGSPEIARLTIMVMDAWTFIPFMMIMLLAGLQAIPREVQEAARVDGASGWRGFWEVTFPLMLPVSITAILIRLIFKLKLADIIINVTAGGPGGDTDSVTSFIFREYRDRSNVGYGTLLAMVYLVLIIIVMTIFMKLSERWTRPQT